METLILQVDYMIFFPIHLALRSNSASIQISPIQDRKGKVK